jgi:hypothetical protein
VSELTLLLLQIGFLILLWFFVFAVVYSLRADLFGVKVRKLAEPAAAGRRPPRHPRPPLRRPRHHRPGRSAAAPAGPQKATRDAVSRIVITSGPKAGLELPHR